MEQRLQKLLIQYAKEGKYADLNFVNIVIDALKCKHGDNGLQNVLVVDTMKQHGESDFQKLEISINIEMIKNNLLEKFGYKDKQSNLYLVNIYIMLVLMHEFNHFRQSNEYYKVIDSATFLDKLFIKSFVFLCSNNVDFINKLNNTNFSSMVETDKFYNEYHDCFVVERLAHTEAYRDIFKIIAPLASIIGMPYYWFLNSFYFYSIKDYCVLDDEIITPFNFLLIGMENHKQGVDLESEDELDVYNPDDFYYEILATYKYADRVSYGLPITENEYFNTLDYMNVMFAMAGNRGVMYEKEEIKKRKKDIK